jgi:hypothetical protein
MTKDQQLLLAVGILGGFIAYSFYKNKNKNEAKSSASGLFGKTKLTAVGTTYSCCEQRSTSGACQSWVYSTVPCSEHEWNVRR